MILGFGTTYRNDRNSKDGGLPLYIREDIPSKGLSFKTNYDIEILIVEINLKKRKWFLNRSCNPNKNQISHYFKCFNRIIHEYNIKYNNFVFISDFNINVNESSMKDFCNLSGLKILINEPV